MKSIALLLLAAASMILTTGCLHHSGGWGTSTYQNPQVQVPSPSSLRLVERTLLPDFSRALQDAGYQPVNSPAEYRASFSITEGPINAVTSMELSKSGQSVAVAQARQGGLTKVLQGSKYAEQSFYRCLQEFSGKLPGQRGYDGGQNQHQDHTQYQNQGQNQHQNQYQPYQNPGYPEPRYGHGSPNSSGY